MIDMLLVFGVIAVILVVTALASGIVERSPLSFPLMFLGLGLILGERGFGAIELGPHDQVLEVTATLTLALVLFLDAAQLQIDELGRRWLVPFLILGPGTALVISLGAVPLALLVGFGWVVAFIGGAILASTDPVVLREILRDHRIPRSVRQTLRIEAGMNDIVVLPVILVLIAVATGDVGGGGQWLSFLLKLLVFGPAIGFAVGGVGAWLMNQADRAFSVRREHQALYGIGLVLAAYTAATAAGGDGFLGAFAAGLSVVVLNQTLCECFLDYGETTSEVAMMLTFVLFGVVLSGILGTVSWVPAIVLGLLVIFVIRPSVLSAVLFKAHMSWEARAFISWFGPRGLNSLLLALLVVVAGIEGSELLLATVGVVVIGSVFIHGATATPFSAWYGRKAEVETFDEEREGTVADLFGSHEDQIPRITIDALYELMNSETPPIVLDVRSRANYETDGGRIPGGIRVLPDEVTDWASGQPRDRLVVAYCT